MECEGSKRKTRTVSTVEKQKGYIHFSVLFPSDLDLLVHSFTHSSKKKKISEHRQARYYVKYGDIR